MGMKMKVKVTNFSLELGPFLAQTFAEYCLFELRATPDFVLINGVLELDESTGMCIDEDPGEFTLLVATENRTLSEVYRTIAHELVHVKQYMFDDLGSLLDSPKPPYEQRWWEREAYELSEKFLSDFSQIVLKNRLTLQ